MTNILIFYLFLAVSYILPCKKEPALQLSSSPPVSSLGPCSDNVCCSFFFFCFVLFSSYCNKVAYRLFSFFAFSFRYAGSFCEAFDVVTH